MPARPQSILPASQPFVMRAKCQQLSTQARGFTLIEVMLAIVITVFVALLAYNGLSVSMTAAEQHERQVAKLAAIQLPLTVLERDIRGAVLRSIKNEFDETLAPLSGGALNEYLLVLTRRGWDNPRGLPRGELQRVRYQLEGDELWRESWSVLDRVNLEASQRRILLLKGVNEVQLLFLKSQPGATNSPLGGEWLEEWDDTTSLPLAIDITLELEEFGVLRRVYSIPLE